MPALKPETLVLLSLYSYVEHQQYQLEIRSLGKLTVYKKLARTSVFPIELDLMH